MYVSGKLPTYPSPNLTFCPNQQEQDQYPTAPLNNGNWYTEEQQSYDLTNAAIPLKTFTLINYQTGERTQISVSLPCALCNTTLSSFINQFHENFSNQTVCSCLCLVSNILYKTTLSFSLHKNGSLFCSTD